WAQGSFSEGKKYKGRNVLCYSVAAYKTVTLHLTAIFRRSNGTAPSFLRLSDCCRDMRHSQRRSFAAAVRRRRITGYPGRACFRGSLLRGLSQRENQNRWPRARCASHPECWRGPAGVGERATKTQGSDDASDWAPTS